MRRHGWVILALVLVALFAWQQRTFAPKADSGAPRALPDARPSPQSSVALPRRGNDAAHPAFLPREALATVQRIERGGPHPYRQDGATFENRERRLPSRPRGYYREYTVVTPGSGDRGARRIIAGGGIPDERRPVEYFYSDDHYRSFRRFAPSHAETWR